MDATLFSDFLKELGVAHTVEYSDKAYRAMPFQSCFGLKKLLAQYGIDSEGLSLTDKSEISKLPTPFLARMSKGFVIVTDVDEQTVSYLSESVTESAPADVFINAWQGMAFIAYPTPQAKEPDYGKHLLNQRLAQAKHLTLILAIATLLGYFIIEKRIFSHAWAIAAMLFNCAGLFFTWLLVKKSLHIKSHTGDKVCGVIEQHGCDNVLSTKAASFFGLFGWSEVGFAYFSVSLIALLAFPQASGSLALCNLCCLPFSFWSVWYQKTRAKAWCTLCLCVQATLWALFFCYLGGGLLKHALSPDISIVPLIAAYASALLGLNRLMPLIEKPEPNEEDETDITP